MTRLITIAATTLVLAGGSYFWQSGQQSSLLSAFGAAEAQAAEGEVDTSIVREMVLGDPDADVEVIEYASFTCPHCKNFHQGVFKDLKSDYIDTGKIRFVYREVYFDRFGLWAGMIARCGVSQDATVEADMVGQMDDPGASEMTDETMAEAGAEAMEPAGAAAPDLDADTRRYFAIAEMIYDQQAEWTAGDTPAAIAENLAKIGRTAGLGADQVDACLQDAELAQAMVAVYQQNAEADDIRSTPSFIIDGEKYSNMPYDEFAALLDGKLAE